VQQSAAERKTLKQTETEVSGGKKGDRLLGVHKRRVGVERKAFANELYALLIPQESSKSTNLT